MFHTGGSPVWPDRWQALQQELTHLQANLPGPTLQALAASLNAFGESQFNFFRNGFTNGRLQPSAPYPIEYVLQATLDQVGYDIAVYQQAAYQRRGGNAGLQKADQLAYLALEPAVKSGLLKQATVFTYFNKSPLSRNIPYAPLALVAVPFTSTAVPRDLLATPHEIGHYVYWNSPGLIAALRDLLPVQPDWLSRWQEEIFADVYGCLIAGPVIGLDFQDILFDDSLEDFMSDDGEHPVEAIRPYGYTKVLAQLGFTNAAAALNKRWQTMLDARNNPEYFIPVSDFEQVSLEEARIKLEAFALKILDYLTKTRGFNPKKFWSQDLPNGAEVETLYKKFDKWVNNLPSAPAPSLRVEGDMVGVDLNGELKNKRQLGATQTWIDNLKRQTDPTLPPEAWIPAISSDGWNVNGPDDWWP
jgi:hypothetical protein